MFFKHNFTSLTIVLPRIKSQVLSTLLAPLSGLSHQTSRRSTAGYAILSEIPSFWCPERALSSSKVSFAHFLEVPFSKPNIWIFHIIAKTPHDSRIFSVHFFSLGVPSLWNTSANDRLLKGNNSTGIWILGLKLSWFKSLVFYRQCCEALVNSKKVFFEILSELFLTTYRCKLVPRTDIHERTRFWALHDGGWIKSNGRRCHGYMKEETEVRRRHTFLEFSNPNTFLIPYSNKYENGRSL